MHFRCLPLKAWVEKHYSPPYTIPSYFVRESEDGTVSVFARNSDPHSLSYTARDKDFKVCELPSNLMTVHVPHISGGIKDKENIRSGTYVGEVADMMQLQIMVDNLNEELSLAISVVNDFLKS